MLYKIYINHGPGMTLTYITSRSALVAHAFGEGKLLKCNLKGKTCRKWANGQKVYENKLCPWGCLLLPRGYIHVYDHNIQTSSSLKPLVMANQSRALRRALLGRGNESLYKWSR